MQLSSKYQATAIMAVYNSQATVEDALQTLLAQSIPLEIIVVDDGSSDNTQSLLTSITKKNPNANIKLLKQNHSGPAIARNLASKHATSSILLFVDADMTFDPNYVKDLIQPIKEGKVIGTYTKEERVQNWDSVYARLWNKEQGWEDRRRFPQNTPKWGTDFRAILRTEFEKVKGFDNTGYTDTWTLFQKLGIRPLVTNAICYHKNPDTLKYVFRQAKWSAKRPYKLGFVGQIYALIRTSLPLSFILCIINTIRYQSLRYPAFKLTYDLGRFSGILEMMLTKNLTK